MFDIKNLEPLIDFDVQDISCIVYRNEDLGIGGRRYRHIDIELCYGEFVESNENEPLYQQIFEWCNLAEHEDREEIILYALE